MLLRFRNIATLALLTAAASAAAQSAPALSYPSEAEAPAVLSLESIVGGTPLPLLDEAIPSARPRLSVALDPSGFGPTRGWTGAQRLEQDRGPAIAWSLEAWEMKTASLAHIQCSRAVRNIEHFLVEDCRFVEGPLPKQSTGLVQLSGQWLAMPSLALGAGVYSGFQPVDERVVGTPMMFGTATPQDRLDGVNVNLSFGLALGSVGDLLLDLQVDRYRQRPQSLAPWYGAGEGFDSVAITPWLGPDAGARDAVQTAGELGIGWRGRSFGADLTGQYRELPYWFGEQLQGQGFSSFDIEFSWRAPTRASISVGVNNVLDNLPASAAGATEQGIEAAVDGIYGRIPYVRYKHDL